MTALVACLYAPINAHFRFFRAISAFRLFFTQQAKLIFFHLQVIDGKEGAEHVC